MGNMGYCRFQNTLPDLRDCYKNWDDAKSIEEQKARKHLLDLCQQIVNDFTEDDE